MLGHLINDMSKHIYLHNFVCSLIVIQILPVNITEIICLISKSKLAGSQFMPVLVLALPYSTIYDKSYTSNMGNMGDLSNICLDLNTKNFPHRADIHSPNHSIHCSDVIHHSCHRGLSLGQNI